MKTKHVLTTGLAVAVLGACQTSPEAPLSSEVCQVTEPFRTTKFDSDFEADIDALMAHMVERNIAPGAVVRIDQGGQTVFSRAYGHADLEEEKPMKEDSLFRIYSMTKAITTVAALQLVEDGRIDLDAPVSTYLPAFETVQVRANAEATETRAPARAPTIRDLVTHISGLTYRTGVGSGPVADLYLQLGVHGGPGLTEAPANGMEPVVGNQAFIDRIVQAPLVHDPGTAFTYSNSTDVLGIIVAEVTGQSLGDYMAENIFAPAGMTDTAFQLDPARTSDFTSLYTAEGQGQLDLKIDESNPVETFEAITPQRVDPWNRSLYLLPQPIEFGGAGLVSDADDYLAFANALLDGRLISDDMWAQVRTDQLPETVDRSATWLDERTFGLGFALRTDPTRDRATFPQCGLYWSGAASTYYWIDPETDTTGVLMTQVLGGNVRDYFADLVEIVYGAPE
ncbi:serine hydrolase domain-containing protein [uncultured Algimonas sp.]|uniref:serine hydrolase domain-containing protein n=1 Tax=uncultured Algimonas sp. TaxID=1547920 RepID=UPI002620B1EF|nr:serine hydrolase domain-containing protein [uncultured Algimonas sp.]